MQKHLEDGKEPGQVGDHLPNGALEPALAPEQQEDQQTDVGHQEGTCDACERENLRGALVNHLRGTQEA